MHSNHDIAHVWALAEGTSEDPAAARRLVDECPECAAAYADLVTVRGFIAQQPPVELSDMERARLRRGIWNELSVQSANARSAGLPWLYRVASVAAAMAMVIGVGYVFTNIGGVDSGGAAASATTAAGDMAAADTAESDESADDADVMMSMEEGAAESAGEGATRNYGATTFEEASEDFALRVEMSAFQPASEFDCETPEVPLAVERATVGQSEVFMVAFGAEPEVESVRILDVADCSTLHETP